MERAKTFKEIKEKCGKVFAKIIKKQFDIIGIDVHTFVFNDGWQSKYEWTTEQKDRFRIWFLNYLYGNVKKVGELVQHPWLIYKDKKKLIEFWNWWYIDYGWKDKEECNE